MDTNPLTTPVGRRTVMVAAAATGFLAACGSSDSGTSGTGGTDSSGGQASGGASANPAGEVLATTAEVPLDGGIVNKDGKYVVTQPAAGEYKAFSSVCPHQQCQVNQVQDNKIICPCHGSVFSAETGDVEKGPAPRGLATIGVVVEGDSIVRA